MNFQSHMYDTRNLAWTIQSSILQNIFLQLIFVQEHSSETIIKTNGKTDTFGSQPLRSLAILPYKLRLP